MSLDPQYVGDVLSDIRQVGKATGEEAKAETLADRMQARIDAVVNRVSLATHKPKVLHTEWVDPLMCGGHWVPEMVEMAGGFNCFEYIARNSVLPADGGYAWKFDDDLPATMKGGERYPEDYAALSLPLGVIYGADSELFSEQTLAYMRGLIPQEFPAVALADAQHHLFLDQPLTFVAALRDMLATLS